MKNNKNLPFWLIGLIIVIAIIIAIAARQPKTILFYSTNCPHCQNVEKYIAENNVREKIKFQELEVSANQGNAKKLESRAAGCGLNTDQGVGIPLLFADQKCYQGDQNIINYFQNLK